MISTIFLMGLGLVGTAAIVVSVFWFFFTHYDMLEQRILNKISNYALEIYDYFDRMFKRKPMNHCYLIILVPTVVFSLLGLMLALKLGLLFGLGGAVFFGFIGFKLPGNMVRFIFNRRVSKFDKQLVDALNMMANAIKSGLSFLQVIQVIEKEMPNPCSQEFAMVLKENRVGINLSDALLNMTKRMPSEDLFMIINSVVTLSQQGGDLSEAFDTISKTIRERQRVSEKIKTLSQAGITQGMILSIIPFVFLGIEWFIQPQYVILLFTTPLGLGMLVGMCCLLALGALWMKKLLTIDI